MKDRNEINAFFFPWPGQRKANAVYFWPWSDNSCSICAFLNLRKCNLELEMNDVEESIPI